MSNGELMAALRREVQRTDELERMVRVLLAALVLSNPRKEVGG